MREIIKIIDALSIVSSVCYIIITSVLEYYDLHRLRIDDTPGELRMAFGVLTLIYFLNILYFALVRTPLRRKGYKTLYRALFLVIVLTFLIVVHIITYGELWSF